MSGHGPTGEASPPKATQSCWPRPLLESINHHAFSPSSPFPPPPLQVLEYWTVPGLNKWVDVGIQCGMAAIYRLLFWAALAAKERFRL